MAGKKKVGKDDLRRLMKETRSIKGKLQQVDSPFAKYNALGQLVCIVCNSVVKSNKLWNAHLLSRSHKEKYAVLKAKQEAINRGSVPQPNKRKLDTKESPVPEKKLKGILVNKSLGLDDYSSSSSGEDSDEDSDPQSSNSKPQQSQIPDASSDLPADFFDAGAMPKPEEEKEEEPKPETMADKLPEGFFDNPQADAKVREVEFKDKMDEEWELFQRTVKMETKVSEAIIDEEDEQVNEERNLGEVDEQIHHWTKINKLAKEKDKIMESAPTETKSTGSNSDSDADLDEYEEFLDWRSKGT